MPITPGTHARFANLAHRRPPRRRLRPPRPCAAGRHADRHRTRSGPSATRRNGSRRATCARVASPASSARTCRRIGRRDRRAPLRLRRRPEVPGQDRRPRSRSCVSRRATDSATLAKLVAGTRPRASRRPSSPTSTAWNALVDDALRSSRAETVAERRGPRRLARPLHGRDQPATTSCSRRRSSRSRTRSAPRPHATAAASRRAPRRPRRAAADRHGRRAAARRRLRGRDHAQRRAPRARADGSPAQPGRALPDGAHRRPRGRRRRRLHARRDAGHHAARRRAPPTSSGSSRTTFNAMLAKAQRSVEAYGAMRGELGALIGEVSAAPAPSPPARSRSRRSSEEAGRAVGEIASP